MICCRNQKTIEGQRQEVKSEVLIGAPVTIISINSNSFPALVGIYRCRRNRIHNNPLPSASGGRRNWCIDRKTGKSRWAWVLPCLRQAGFSKPHWGHLSTDLNIAIFYFRCIKRQQKIINAKNKIINKVERIVFISFMLNILRAWPCENTPGI